MTPNEILAYVSQKWGESSKASRDAARGTLLVLAMNAREDFPEATGIRIGASDQGDFMDFEALVDADGNALDDTEDFDDETLTWGLDDHNKDAWEPYCTETEQHRRRNPQYVIDIDKVLEGVKLT